MSEYRVKQPGDVLLLEDKLPDVEEGFYVLLSVEDMCCLAMAAEDDRGQICATNVLVDLEWADLSLFQETGLRVDPI